MNRRDFIKSLGIAGGALATGSALAWPTINPAFLRGGPSIGGVTSYALWDGGETGWGDPSNNHIMVMAGAANADESGIGIVTGADLTWSRGGTVPAVDVNGYRQIDLSKPGYFTISSALANAVFDGNTWTYLIEMDAAAYTEVTNDSCILYVAGTNYLYLGIGNQAAGWPLFLQTDAGGEVYLSTTSLSFPAATHLWCGVWSDGTYIRAGTTSTGTGPVGQPLKWSEFGSTARVSSAQNADITNDLTALFACGFSFVRAFSFNARRLLLSKHCLIDNNS